MVGVGRGARQGRRPSSSSPFFSTATMLVVIAFCILAVWIISPTSFFPASSTSSRTGNEPALRSREYLASSFSKRSPSFVYKDNDDGGDAEGGGGGGQEMGAEDVQEVAEEKLPAPIVQKVDLGAEEDSGSAVKGKEAAGESQEEEHQQEQGGVEEDSQREQPIDAGAAANELEQSREAGSEREELPNHAAAGDENGGDGQVQPHLEEAVERSSVQLEDEGLIEIKQQNKDGEGSEQLQQPPEQQEAENTGDDGPQIQQQQESEEGGSGENAFNSDQDQKDASTTEEEGEGADGKEESQQQVEQEESSAIHSTASMQEAEEGMKDSEEQPSQQAHDEKLSDEPHVGDSSKYGSRQEGNSTPWSTQADQSQDEKDRRAESQSQIEGEPEIGTGDIVGHHWRLCNATTGPDYIPCLDNEEFLRHPHSTKHFEHRERHCPEDAPTCLVPLPKGYRRSIEWPKSRNKIWYNNVPHTKLAVVKGHQNWVKVTGEYLTFPGGGTQFIHGALHYIEFLQKSVRNIAWGKHTRTVLDVGCGVASFGGYMFEKDVLTMSFAPKDEHEAQVQFALERGIPAISAVMGSQRLPFPSRAFDLVHCARCRVPWHAEGGRLLLELNRVLRPGGYFVWSATPVYQKLKEDVEIWKEMTSLTKAMCWDLVTIRKDRLNGIGAAIYQKPTSNECYDNRRLQVPPMCDDEDDPDSAWYVPLLSCMHRAPTEPSERGSRWPQEWPRRLRLPPYWLNSSEVGTYGKPVPDDFLADYEHWKRVISKSYLHGLSIDWSKVRNVMDMKAIYGGFAAALKDMKIWVMNVVNVDSPDTLPIIYERGLFGIYHDWCESFSTYPRTYDLLHADHLFARLKKRCNIVPVVVEVDRISRPGGKLILRDEPEVMSEIESILKSLHWEVRLKFTKGREGVLYAEKTDWRPETSLSSL